VQLVVVSHKETWNSSFSYSGFSTIGGFPFQMRAISELFDKTTLVLPVFKTPLPSGAIFLTGHSLSVEPLDQPRGSDLRRKIDLLFWLPRNFPRLWRSIRKTDAVHAPVPGDIGTIGILVALAQRKRLFVRHCGTWGNRTTITDRFLLWLLPRIAGERNVVMATGGGDVQPCPKNPAINWIFATTISEDEWNSVPVNKPWRRGENLKLVSVSRLDPGKNTEAIIKSLPLVRSHYPQTTLNIVGDGPCLKELRTLAKNLDLANDVIFHGRLDHKGVMEVLVNSHLFVFPTRVKEGFPKVVLEAFVCGLPVIAPAISVIPHLIGTDNGFILHDTGPPSVAEAITSLISDDERLGKMSASARETSRQYTLERWQKLIETRLKEAWGPLRNGETEKSSMT
jgi:glycosyltransferase involved in cell wall biosynthesis